MAGSDFWETVQIFESDLQPAISRVTPAILRRIGPFYPGEPVGTISLSEPRVRLNGNGGRCSIDIALRFRVSRTTGDIDRWEIQTFAYSYQFYLDDREFLAYHWDSEATNEGGNSTPHAHVFKELPHAGMQREDRQDIHAMASAHMPTGLIPFTAVLRMVTRDFGVEPIRVKGESDQVTILGVDRVLSVAEAALTASFEWWKRSTWHPR